MTNARRPVTPSRLTIGPMSRRADPVRIQHARGEATAGRLRDIGLPPAAVAEWIAAWQRIGEGGPAADFWQRGEAWISGEVAARRKPPTGG
jgi:hypothetical protein